jgi:RNA polymerase sigma-70 factor (ECF subfamily)
MPPLPETRFSLLARLAEPADVDAWSEFLAIYEQAIYRYARSRSLQDADAWEVVQQVLLAVHQKIGEWRPEGRAGSFRCWLLETAHRVCLRALRDVRRPDRSHGKTEIAGHDHFLAEPIDARGRSDDWERWAFCWAAGFVEREVESSTWQAFWLTAVEGASPAEAARRLGVKIGSIYTAKCRVIIRIRELVQTLSRSDE